jgi:hypothetical protein
MLAGLMSRWTIPRDGLTDHCCESYDRNMGKSMNAEGLGGPRDGLVEKFRDVQQGWGRGYAVSSGRDRTSLG